MACVKAGTVKVRSCTQSPFCHRSCAKHSNGLECHTVIRSLQWFSRFAVISDVVVSVNLSLASEC